MKRICLILSLLLPLAGLAEENYHLVRVIVTGSSRYAQDDLVRATGLRPNSPVTMAQLQQAANSLGSCGAFSSVKFQYKAVTGPRGSVEADFQVKDADKYLPVSFENLIWYSDADLQRTLNGELPLFNGSLPLSGTLPDDLKDTLARFQSSKGLPAEVSYMLAGEIGQPPSLYRFKLDNANLKIKEFHFSGTNHVAPEVLTQALVRARGTDYLRSDVAKNVSASLLPLYREMGFLQAGIAEIQASLQDAAVVIAVTVNEGGQYRLAGYNWSGNSLVSSNDLSKYITLKVGEPVNANKLNHDLAQARKLFLKFGREAATITPVPSFTDQAVAYVFTVREGDLYRMGELEIDGFDADTASKLKASWKLAPGSPYDNTYVTEFLFRTLALAHGHQKNWAVIEQTDHAQKIVNVHLELKGE